MQTQTDTVLSSNNLNKRREEVADTLKKNGFDCSIKTSRDGDRHFVKMERPDENSYNRLKGLLLGLGMSVLDWSCVAFEDTDGSTYQFSFY